MGDFMKREPKRSSVSFLPLPVRKPPARVMPKWEDPPPFTLVDWQRPYLILRLVTPENAHLLHQEPLEAEGEGLEAP